MATNRQSVDEPPSVVDETPNAVRVGRPPKVDADGRPTRQRLIAAATAACVEHGFEGATLSDIAARAQVSTPAVYNHFAGKTELLVAACQWALGRLRSGDSFDPRRYHDYIDLYLSDDFAGARTLQLELHLASTRHSDVRALLARWHRENAAEWSAGGSSLATVKAWYALLLGLAQLDALATLEVDVEELRIRAHRMADALFTFE